MADLLSLNGELLPAREGLLSASNRSFRYGDGFFETVRVSQGKIMWLSRHYQRIVNSAQLLSMSLGEGFSPEYLSETLYAVYRENHPDNAAARIRVSFFRNQGGLYTPTDNGASMLIETTALEDDLYVLNAKGLMVSIYPHLKKSTDFLSGIKSSSALLYVLGGIYCSSVTAEDCLLLNSEGNLAEALSSNLFIVKDRELFTPALDQGCVHGIMRSVVLDLAPMLRIKAHEVILAPQDLEGADEFFLTNTIHGIRWVAGYGTRRYFNKMAPMLVQALNRHSAENDF